MADAPARVSPVIALAAGVLLLLAGAVVQLVGVRSGAYSSARSLRDRLPYGLGAAACWLAAALLLAIGGFQTAL